MKSRRIALVGIVAIACVVLGLSPVLSSRARQAAREASLPVLFNVPAFQFTDADGGPFTRERLEGKVWVADFFFSTCQGPCPTMVVQMGSLHRRYQDEDRVRLVSISVDPETDTPEVLRAYAEAHEADTARWHFLTGPIEDVYALARDGFKVASGERPMMHDARFILVDSRGRVRGYYNGVDPAEVDELAQHIDLLLEGIPS